MNKADYIKYRQELLEQMNEIALNRINEYANDDDVFANLEACEKLGVTRTERGILTRMADKFGRLTNLSIHETQNIEEQCIDLANYAILLSIYIKKNDI